MRCFIAIGSRTDVAASLAAWLDQGRKRFPELSVTPAHNLHLTLSFLGELDEAQVEAADAATAAAASQARRWELGWGDPGAFPGRRRPRVIWLGAGDGVDRLHEVQGALVAELAARGLPVDAKPYRPHLTLARVRRPPLAEATAVGVGEWLGSMPQVPPLAVDSLVLFRSTLGKPAAVHTPVATASLGPYPGRDGAPGET